MGILECFTFDGFFLDAGWPSRLGMLFTNPRYSVLVLFRLQQALHARHRRLSRLCARFNSILNGGVEISNLAKLGRGIDFHHTQGVVIGGDAVLEDGVQIFGRVTLGTRNGRYPRVRRGALLHAGCVIVGGIEIGEFATVGPNSLVARDVPPGDVVVGVPARSAHVLGFVRSLQAS